jgi:hypothetical protein
VLLLLLLPLLFTSYLFIVSKVMHFSDIKSGWQEVDLGSSVPMTLDFGKINVCKLTRTAASAT